MARKATGQVIAPTSNRPSWAIRFRAYGRRRYLTLGRPEEGWDRQRAEAELRHVLADVERGIWRPPEPAPASERREEPTFHEFASEWFEPHRPEWRESTAGDYQVGAELSLAAVLREPAALGGNRRAGRPLQGREAARGAARARDP